MDIGTGFPDIPEMADDVEIITFGCRLNAYESEVMRKLAQNAPGEELVVVNTCAVTGPAEREARQAIRRVRRERPEAQIVVTGCAAQIRPDLFAAMPEVDRILGNQEKLSAEQWRSETPQARVVVSDIMAVREAASHLITSFNERSRAFVQVQNGCDHRCTFCIIPFGRGPSRSIPVEDVVSQVSQLAQRGIGEVVLCGVDTTAYGADLPTRPTLGTLVQEVLRGVPELPRLRLSSIDPVEIDEVLWKALRDESRLMPHLHLSLQAGDDTILKRMKRRHSREDARRVVTRARSIRPDIVFGADLIAGFPTETEEMFSNTLDLVDELGLVYLHVFPYSPRPGTPAARMPQIPGPVPKQRAALLRKRGDALRQQHLERKLGTTEEILMESDNVGRTADFACVRLDEPMVARSLVRARIEGWHQQDLRASVVAMQERRGSPASC